MDADNSKSVCEVVITAPSQDWLIEFARDLVNRRLCASAHSFASIRAIYRWRGEVYDKPEYRVALHTRHSLVGEIVRLTIEHHPYEVPSVSVLPIVDGNPDYLEWIVGETL
ncbi:MAG TPA: divalent-cation tolerance protein CutA [Pseudonocardiaceae bacterium]|nr:divalent-cation tolerance protein CutA [Pseudonocardiaceae bacterium]